MGSNPPSKWRWEPFRQNQVNALLTKDFESHVRIRDGSARYTLGVPALVYGFQATSHDRPHKELPDVTSIVEAATQLCTTQEQCERGIPVTSNQQVYLGGQSKGSTSLLFRR